MDRLSWMQSFVRAAETGSFSAVARELDTTQPTVSKHVASLERYLGARLFNRSTRNLTLTDEGSRYYTYSQRILEQMQTAEADIRGGSAEAIGVLRVNAPVSFGRMHIAPYVREFLDANPRVRLELDLADRFVDIIEEGVDVAVRIGELEDSALVARRIGVTQLDTVASPAYVKAHGKPEIPGDLENHECIVYSSLRRSNEWRFEGPDGSIVQTVDGNFRTNSSEAVLSSVLAGVGIAVTPCWMIADALEAGKLVSLLPDYAPRPMPIQAVFPSNRHMSAKVRKFVEFLGDVFARDDVGVHGTARAA
ncbi:LysR family transcriptional regulator [bacterium]|nr:LysR family transcriptional regulator [bacterium]